MNWFVQMKSGPDELDILSFHSGIGRVYQAGFSRRQVDDRVRNYRDKKQQDNTLAYAFDDELGHVIFRRGLLRYGIFPSLIGREKRGN